MIALATLKFQWKQADGSAEARCGTCLAKFPRLYATRSWAGLRPVSPANGITGLRCPDAVHAWHRRLAGPEARRQIHNSGAEPPNDPKGQYRAMLLHKRKPVAEITETHGKTVDETRIRRPICQGQVSGPAHLLSRLHALFAITLPWYFQSSVGLEHDRPGNLFIHDAFGRG